MCECVCVCEKGWMCMKWKHLVLDDHSMLEQPVSSQLWTLPMQAMKHKNSVGLLGHPF